MAEPFDPETYPLTDEKINQLVRLLRPEWQRHFQGRAQTSTSNDKEKS